MSDPGTIGRSPAPDGLQVLPVAGLPEFRPGDDLATVIADAAPWIAAGDVLVVTSKVVSKAEGRLVAAPADPEQREAFRRALVDAETVRLVAQIGRTKIVENRLGLVAAAAGIDASNVFADEIALLPEDPDGSAAGLVLAFGARGVRVGVVITDTQGRAWRDGVTDVAIGAAGIRTLEDHRGGIDEHGNELVVTQVAVGDEMAAAADLVKGKLSGVPVAVLRGLDAPGLMAPENRSTAALLDTDAGAARVTDPRLLGGGRRLIRPHAEDLFRLGTDLALERGREQTALWSALDLDLASGPDPDTGTDSGTNTGTAVARALGVAPLEIRANLQALELRHGDDQLVVVASDPADDLPDLMPAGVRAGALLQIIRGVLVTEGAAANWLRDVPDGLDVPGGWAVHAAIRVGRPAVDPAPAFERPRQQGTR